MQNKIFYIGESPVVYAAANKGAAIDLDGKEIERGSNAFAYRLNNLTTSDGITFTADEEALSFVHWDSVKKETVNDGNTFVPKEAGDYAFYYVSGEGIYVSKVLSGTVTLYLTNGMGWENLYAYAWKQGSEPLEKNAAWPGVAMTDTGAENEYHQAIYSVSVDLSQYARTANTR